LPRDVFCKEVPKEAIPKRQKEVSEKESCGGLPLVIKAGRVINAIVKKNTLNEKSPMQKSNFVRTVLFMTPTSWTRVRNLSTGVNAKCCPRDW
jgi:hypothetical protein